MQIQFTPTSAKLYFSYYGLDPNNGGKQSHADASGNLVLNTPSSKPTGAISNPAPSGPINFPMLNAARLYVSVGQPLLFAVNPAGAPIPPNPADPNDPNYGTQWDFYELTYIPQAGTTGLFNFNLSNVQSANLPLSFHVTGKDPSNKQPVDYTRGWLPGGFQKFLSYLGANTDFKQLVLPGTQRVLAPGTAITAYTQKIIPSPLFNADYLKDYIAQVWTKFASVDLTFVGDPPPNSNTFVTWTGRVQNGQFTFKTDFGHGLVPIVLNPPSTSDMFENNFLFCVSGCGDPGSLQQNYALQIFGTFCAAFNRSMMLLTTTLANSSDCEWCKAKDKFYQDPTTNHYAKSIHANCIDQLAYAFQSDDHCDTSSYVSLIDAPMVTVTLNP